MGIVRPDNAKLFPEIKLITGKSIILHLWQATSTDESSEPSLHPTEHHLPRLNHPVSHLESIMGSSHSKPVAKKSTRVKKVKTPPLNTYLAADSFGYATYFDDFMFKARQISHCYLCSQRLDAGHEIVFHNTQRCQGAFHANCMRRWLLRFIDSRGRHSRPRCVKCDRSLNIRQGNGGRTKQNPLGDFKPF